MVLFCQGNFNSDNCLAGGRTLDYGPFGFVENFNPRFQPWTGGGDHFSFFNQPEAAEVNYMSFLSALRPLVKDNKNALEKIIELSKSFSVSMKNEMEQGWIKTDFSLKLLDFRMNLKLAHY